MLNHLHSLWDFPKTLINERIQWIQCVYRTSMFGKRVLLGYCLSAVSSSSEQSSRNADWRTVEAITWKENLYAHYQSSNQSREWLSDTRGTITCGNLLMKITREWSRSMIMWPWRSSWQEAGMLCCCNPRIWEAPPTPAKRRVGVRSDPTRFGSVASHWVDAWLSGPLFVSHPRNSVPPCLPSHVAYNS